MIGLIILALSLAFFYLYLVYVFPLDELEPTGDGAAMEASSARPGDTTGATAP